MFRAILIDDEPIITEGLRVFLDWNSLDIELVGLFNSSTKALAFIQEHKPEIVLLDICMPRMDGIELIRRVKELQINTKFIILSGYSEFAFAQQAVNSGAECYLLKPVVKEQLIEAVKDACSKLHQENLHAALEQRYRNAYNEIIPFLREKFFNDLASGALKEREIAEKAESLGLELHSTGFAAAVIAIDSSEVKEDFAGESAQQMLRFAIRDISGEILGSHQAGHVFYMENYICLFLNAKERDLTNIEIFDLLNEIRDCGEGAIARTITIGTGNLYRNILEYKNTYKEAILALNSRFIAGNNKVIHINNILDIQGSGDSGHSYPFELEENIVNSIKAMNSDEAVRNMERISEAYLECSGGSRDKIINLYIELVIIILRKLQEINYAPGDNEAKGKYIAEILRKHTHEELREYVSGLCQWMIEDLSKRYKRREEGIVDMVKGYIDLHFTEDISLKTLSGIVYMNPSYLSYFYKTHTGKNISEYILRARMNKALGYLLQSDMTVYDIASRIGYADPRRFSDAFRKFYGMNPADYKLKLKKRP